MSQTVPLDLGAIKARVAELPPNERWVSRGLGVELAKESLDPSRPRKPNEFYTDEVVCYMSAWLHSSYDQYAHDPDICTRRGKFIAHSREDVPALVAEVERLRAEIDRLRQEGCYPLPSISANTTQA